MPDWRDFVRRRLAGLNLSAGAESNLVEEIAQHLEDRHRELTAAGVSDRDAYAEVSRELDDIELLRASTVRERMPHTEPVAAGEWSRGGFLDGLWRDCRYAARTMRKSPAFAVVVAVILALGIGANTTVFTLFNTLLLNPLPAREPGRLAGVAGVDADTSKPRTPFPLSYAELRDYQANNQSFESLAGYTSPNIVTRREGDVSQVLFAELVTGNYFRTLGIEAAAGRFFAPEEDATGGPDVAVINYATWQTRFGGAPDIVGRTVSLNHVVFTIVGVAPKGFIGVNAIFGPDFWLPASTIENVWPAEMRNALRDRGKAVFWGIGRYRPQVGREQAQANVATLAAALAREYPSTNEGHTAAVLPLRDAILRTAGGASSAQIVFAGVALLGLVCIVLLIACSNITNLLMARSAARRHEIAVRLALGAGRARLMRQLLTEALLLGVLGGAGGLLVGYAGLRGLFSALPNAANFATPRFDGVVFGYAALLSVATAFVFGTAPALRALKVDVGDTLKEAGRTVGRSRRGVSLSNVLLVSQVAFSFLLLVTAALFLRSIGRAYQMDPGFEVAHLAVFSTNAGQTGYSRQQTAAFYREVRDRVSRMPGIISAGWSSNMPLWARAVDQFRVEGRQAKSKNDTIRAVMNTVDPAYFETAGIAILAGRAFTEFDRGTSAPVAIVNEAMAKGLWPDGAIGRRIQFPGETQMRQVVGVARTANYTSWGEAPQFAVYVPLDQSPSNGMALYVRTKGDPLDAITPVEREIHAVDPGVVVTMPRTGRQIMDGGLFSARMGVVMLSLFGLLGLVLASAGLYGILAYAATTRRREIGVRMALGASRAKVLQLIVAEGMKMVLAGIAIGLVCSLIAGRLLSRMLYGVSAMDPLSIGAAGAVLVSVALAACYIPARSATRVDPLDALREG